MTAAQVHLRLTPELAEKIRKCSCDGLSRPPQLLAEVGGLIVSAGAPDSPGYEIILVPCEYHFRTTWQFTDPELGKLRKAVRNCETEGKSVIAYFRSCTRPEMQVEREDRRAIAAACTDVPFVLLARPFMNGGASISVFNRGAGGRWRMAQQLDVPSPESGLGVIGTRTVPAAAPHLHSEPPDYSLAEDSPDRRPMGLDRRSMGLDRRPMGKETLTIAGVAILVGMAGFAALWLRARNPGPSPAPRRLSEQTTIPAAAPVSELGLEVREENGNLHVTWNRNSKAVTSASFGTLDIDDSGKAKSILLLPVDITAGSVIYKPRSSDITFRLQVRNAASERTEERIRVLGNAAYAGNSQVPRAGALAAPPSEVEQPPVSTARTVTLSSSPEVKPAPVPAPAPAPSVATAQPPALSGPPPARTEAPAPVTAEVAKVQKSEAPAPTAAPKPQPLPALVEQARVTPPENLPVAPPAAVPSPAPASSAPQASGRGPAVTPQAPANSAPQASGRGPAVTPPAPVNSIITPPLPIRQVKPQPLASSGWKIYTRTTVSVNLSVNEQGRVTRASADAPSKAKNPFLANSCAMAAKGWLFKPATRDGRPVEGAFQVDCVFEPNGIGATDPAKLIR